MRDIVVQATFIRSTSLLHDGVRYYFQRVRFCRALSPSEPPSMPCASTRPRQQLCLQQGGDTYSLSSFVCAVPLRCVSFNPRSIFSVYHPTCVSTVLFTFIYLRTSSFSFLPSFVSSSFSHSPTLSFLSSSGWRETGVFNSFFRSKHFF